MTTEHEHAWLPYHYEAKGQGLPGDRELADLILREVICVDCGKRRLL